MFFLGKVNFGKAHSEKTRTAKNICLLKKSQYLSRLVMGPYQNFLTLVGSFFCRSGRVSSAPSGFEKFPLKNTKFSLRIKKIFLDQVKK